MAPKLLQGAPDEDIGLPSGETKPQQVMTFEMNNEVLEELLKCARNGKQPTITFGKSTALRLGNRTIPLAYRPAGLRRELYSASENGSDDWQFAGLVSHALSVKKVESPAVGVDSALETLKNNVASLQKEREAKKTLFTSDLSSSSSGFRTALSSQNKANDDMHGRSFKPAQGSWEMEKPTIWKSNLIHLLAIEPFTLDDCVHKIRARSGDLLPILKKIAEEDKKGYFVMFGKYYKELDPWDFAYADTDRAPVIENAIKAFDRLRIDPKDDIWQKLLPEADRYKGTILSKLKLQPKVLTPSMKPKILDKSKAGIKKAATPKREEKKSDDPVKKVEKFEKPSPKTTSKPLSEQVRSPKQPSKIESYRDQFRNNNPARQTSNQKPSASAKNMLNKPKNPSPLSKSPPINASDLEDHVNGTSRSFQRPLYVKSPAKQLIRPAVKRKPAADESLEGVAKKPRTESSSLNGFNKASSSPALKSSSLKRKSTEDSSGSSLDNTPLKLRKLTNGTNEARHRSTPTNNSKNMDRQRNAPHVSDDSATSPELPLSHRERMDIADRFKLEYERYKAWHIRLAKRKGAVDQGERDKFLKLHKKLATWKEQLRGGVVH